MRIIAALRSRSIGLLATLTLGLGGCLLGILQVIAAIFARLLFGFATEQVSLELANFAAEKLHFLMHFFEPLAGSSMHALPIASQLPQFEILALQPFDLGTQLVVLSQQPCRQDHRLAGDSSRLRGFDQHTIHGMLVVISKVASRKEQLTPG